MVALENSVSPPSLKQRYYKSFTKQTTKLLNTGSFKIISMQYHSVEGGMSFIPFFLLFFFFFFLESFNQWRLLLMIAHYHQTKILISFWCRQIVILYFIIIILPILFQKEKNFHLFSIQLFNGLPLFGFLIFLCLKYPHHTHLQVFN